MTAEPPRCGRLFRFILVVPSALLMLASAQLPVLALEASRTTTSVTGTLTSPQAMTGSITLLGATPGTTYELVDSFQALPTGVAGARFYTGTYRFDFTHCDGGTATSDNGPEVIGSGGSFASRPPASSGVSTFTTFPTSTSMRCDYSVAFSGHAPPGPIDSLRADLWVMQNGAVVAQSAGSVVPAPFPPPVAVPEAPYANLLPLAAVALFGLALLFLHRRGEPD